jgi:hypothetical protein
VQRDEAQEEAGVLATMSATSEGVERRNLQGPYTAARRRLGRAERDVTEAAEAGEAADAALCAQQSVRAVLGSDVRSALDRLEIVDSALATLRRREIATRSHPSTSSPCLDPARATKAARNGGSRAPSRSRTGDARLA